MTRHGAKSRRRRARHGRTCCGAVSFLTPLGDEDGDLPVAEPPKGFHCQRDSPTGEEAMKAVAEEEEEEERQIA